MTYIFCCFFFFILLFFCFFVLLVFSVLCSNPVAAVLSLLLALAGWVPRWLLLCVGLLRCAGLLLCVGFLPLLVLGMAEVGVLLLQLLLLELLPTRAGCVAAI